MSGSWGHRLTPRIWQHSLTDLMRSLYSLAVRIYRENFRPSQSLAKPYSLVSIGAIADEDPVEARRQSTSSAMAMLRMFQHKPFALLPPDKVAAFQGNMQERQIIEQYTNQTLHGTADDVAKVLEDLQDQTGIDEVMLVVQGYSRHAQSRTVELIADHYGMPSH